MFGKKKHSEKDEYKKIELREHVSEAEDREKEPNLPAEETSEAEPQPEPEEETSGSESVPEPEEEATGSESAPQPEKEEKPRKRRFVWPKRILLGIFFVAMSVMMTFGYSLWSEFSREDSDEGEEITVEIPKGSTTEAVAAILQDAGIIRYKTSFLAKVYFAKKKGSLRYGNFSLSKGMSLDTIIYELTKGGAKKEEITFTVPEGYSIEMIARKLEQEGIMDSEEFLSAVDEEADKTAFADELPPKDQVFYRLQGYLFPDTYRLSTGAGGKELVDKMLSEIAVKFDATRQKKAKELGLTVQEVLIRASLVQKETQKADEYAMVAGVINNRLARNMKLQFDSTTVYAMTNGLFGVSRVTYDDLRLESPYNTYYVKGLPPGPICNPGLEAIDGVLSPVKHNYLYFQVDTQKNDGSNLFFETYEEHVAASSTTAEKADTENTASEKTTSEKTTTENITSEKEEGKSEKDH